MDKIPLSSDKEITQFVKRGKAVRQNILEWIVLIAQGIIICALLLTVAISALIIGVFPDKIGNLDFFKQLYQSSCTLLVGGFIFRDFDFFGARK